MNWQAGEPNNNEGVDENSAIMNLCVFEEIGRGMLIIGLIFLIVWLVALSVGSCCAACCIQRKITNHRPPLPDGSNQNASKKAPFQCAEPSCEHCLIGCFCP